MVRVAQELLAWIVEDELKDELESSRYKTWRKDVYYNTCACADAHYLWLWTPRGVSIQLKRTCKQILNPACLASLKGNKIV